jgi:hypothetical protein
VGYEAVSLFFGNRGSLAVGPTKPPLQSVSEAMPSGSKQPERENATHFHLMPKLRILGAISHLSAGLFKVAPN